jgi:ankyrin repeat protein
MAAALSGNGEGVRQLLSAGAKVGAFTRCELTSYSTVMGGNRQYTALLFAAEQAHASEVDALIQAGAPASDVDPITGDTPMALAVGNNDTSTASILLAAGASPDGLCYGEPFVCRAATSSHKMLALLLDGHAKVDARERSLTALMLSARYDQEQCSRLLLAHGADASLRNDAGETALDIAKKWASASHIELIRGGSKK